MKLISKLILLIILLELIFSTIPVNSAQSKILYKETIDSYTRYNGETFRWTENREFYILNYHTTQITINNQNVSAMSVTMLDKNQNGYPTITKMPLYAANFQATATQLNDSRLSSLNWEMFMFRDVTNSSVINPYEPFNSQTASLLNQNNIRRYDVVNHADYFSVSLEYYEYHQVNNNITRYKVDTELATNNNPDGRATKIMIFVKKLDANANVLIQFSWSIQEVNFIGKYLNYLDQPTLAVPFEIGIAFLVVYVYQRTYKYWKKNGIKIIKTKKNENNENQ